MDSTKWMRTPAAAQHLGLSPRTLESWRIRGGGPPYFRAPGSTVVIYDIEDLDRWMASGRRYSTSDPGARVVEQAVGGPVRSSRRGRRGRDGASARRLGF